MEEVKMEFKQIPMLNNLYEISSDGKHFRRFSTKKELKIMEGANYGYSQVVFTINKRRPEEHILYSHPKSHASGTSGARQMTLKIHQLVYNAFIGEVPEGMVIDHIDRDKSNNDFTNLRAVTPIVNANNKSRQNERWDGERIILTPKGHQLHARSKDEAIHIIAELTGKSYRTVFNSFYGVGQYRGFKIVLPE